MENVEFLSDQMIFHKIKDNDAERKQRINHPSNK